MVQIAGKYKLENNENFLEYVKSLGVPEDKALKGDSLRPTLGVQVEGGKYSFLSDSGIQNSDLIFSLNEEFDDVMPTGQTVKSIATLNGNTISVQSKHAELGLEGSRTYEFSEQGLVITMQSNKFPGVARRIYVRI